MNDSLRLMVILCNRLLPLVNSEFLSCQFLYSTLMLQLVCVNSFDVSMLVFPIQQSKVLIHLCGQIHFQIIKKSVTIFLD